MPSLRGLGDWTAGDGDPGRGWSLGCRTWPGYLKEPADPQDTSGSLVQSLSAPSGLRQWWRECCLIGCLSACTSISRWVPPSSAGGGGRVRSQGVLEPSSVHLPGAQLHLVGSASHPGAVSPSPGSATFLCSQSSSCARPAGAGGSAPSAQGCVGSRAGGHPSLLAFPTASHLMLTCSSLFLTRGNNSPD